MLTSAVPRGLDAGLIALIIASTFGVFLCACRQIRRPYPTSRELNTYSGREPHFRNTDSPGADPVPPYEPPVFPLSTFFTPAPSYGPPAPGHPHFPPTPSYRTSPSVIIGGQHSPTTSTSPPPQLSFSSSWGVPDTRLSSPSDLEGLQDENTLHYSQHQHHPSLDSNSHGPNPSNSQVTSSAGIASSLPGLFSDASRIPRPTQAHPRIHPHFEAIVQPPITRASSLPTSAQRGASEKLGQTEVATIEGISKLRYSTDLAAQALTSRAVDVVQPDILHKPDCS
ncbi:hypothetical protein CFIMG_008307RA00001 [Ceratocystis fimbriata CBS 114723]|uniref:Uncharacterized protein n=1 Tax=Ceratocystis fimbriata CBS 114723 TaxID=1035309 RepID=A0A2C5X4P7_9PEZI|nr:hypothetical protein CFIMG_008307RA00001 [Ceratocystis fimbriata CBS 114723]